MNLPYDTEYHEEWDETFILANAERDRFTLEELNHLTELLRINGYDIAGGHENCIMVVGRLKENK